MELFKKKKTKSHVVENPRSVIQVEKLSDESLEIFYDTLQKEYKITKSPETQHHLVIFSKELTDRAYAQGNGKVKKFFISKGVLTEEKWNQLTDDKKKEMSVLKEQIERTEANLKSLTEPSKPEKIEISIKQNDTVHDVSIGSDPPEQELDLQRQEEEREKEIEYEVKKRVIAELNKQNSEKVFLDNVEVKEPNSVENPGDWKAEPKKKKGLGSLFKKKIPKQRPSSVEDVIKSGVTPEQKERAKKMEQATIKKHKTEDLLKKVFTKTKKEKKPKVSLPDIYCPDCTHPLKAHQSKGVSVGCKCGCLNTIEQIAEKHGVQLFSPKEVLDNISKENPEPEYYIPEIKDEKLLEQAKALGSFIPKIEPGDTITSKKGENPVLKKKIPQPMAKREPLHEGMCANCDHIPTNHFESNGFCTVIGCTCENFRSYPK